MNFPIFLSVVANVVTSKSVKKVVPVALSLLWICTLLIILVHF